jgi:antimicrobial peptide system SdpA family protein
MFRISKPNMLRLRIIVVLQGYSTFFILFFLAGLAVVLPSNLLFSNSEYLGVRSVVNGIVSENFAFFTRSPQSEQLDAYQTNSLISLLTTPQSKSSNLMGISRNQRAQGPEFAMLIKQVGASWLTCADRSWGCVIQAREGIPIQLRNISPTPTICGNVILTIEKIVKWAYRDSVDGSYVILRTAHADVSCKALG